jgi:hypothetical protein
VAEQLGVDREDQQATAAVALGVCAQSGRGGSERTTAAAAAGS